MHARARGPTPERARRSMTGGACRRRRPRSRRAPPPVSDRRPSRPHRLDDAGPESPDCHRATLVAVACVASTASCDGAVCYWYPCSDDAGPVSHRGGWSVTSTVAPRRGPHPIIDCRPGHDKERSSPSAGVRARTWGSAGENHHQPFWPPTGCSSTVPDVVSLPTDARSAVQALHRDITRTER